MKKFLFPLLLVFTFIFSCTDENDECEDIACIAIVNEITVNLTDSTNNPVVLDSYKVIDLSNGSEITPMNNNLQNDKENGRYLIAIDASVDRFESKEIQFQGVKDSTLNIASNYIIEGDCCGVSLVSGNLNLKSN